MKRKTFQRRLYENAAMVAVRERRQIVLFWARRCHKSTTLGSIAFDEMSRENGRTVIAASASLLLGKELVGFALSATEQAAIVTKEAAAMRTVFQNGADDKALNFKVADGNKILEGLTDDDFAELYKSSSMELRLYFDRTSYSRLKVIAPNPATARGWGGTVLRDEAGYTPVQLENDLRVATKPIIDTDPTFKLIYACNLCPNDRHPFFEMTLPPPDLNFTADPKGHFYLGQNGILVHRVSLADAYAAGHVLYDDQGKPLTYQEFVAKPQNKLGAAINYTLTHEAGGTAAIDFVAMDTSQRRGAVNKCSFIFVEDDQDWKRAMELLRENLGDGQVGIGFDVASTINELSNPSSITVTEKTGTDRCQRLVAVFKSKHRKVMSARLKDCVVLVAGRPEGGNARRMCIDASNERLAAEETADDLRQLVPVELVLGGGEVKPLPPGYEEKDGNVNYKTYLGDLYSRAVNENRYSLPPDEYIKVDQRLPMKDAGRYVCVPDADGRHGDTFDSGKLAEWALSGTGGAITPEIMQKIRLPATNPSGRPIFYPRRLNV